MEERDGPVRAWDGAGPDLATPLPAQHPHRPVRVDPVNPQLAATDVRVEPVSRADSATTDAEEMVRTEGVDAWSAAEAEAVGSASTGVAEESVPPATDSRPAEAHRDGDKPQPYKLRRAAACAALFVAVVTTLLCFLLVIAAGTEDSAIESHTGRADAEVVDVTTHRTLVRFQTPDGAEHVPNVGVLYPEALEEGQIVRVEYDLREPDLVRVAGRGATLTFLPAFTTLLAVWAVTVGLVWWLRKPGPLHLRSLRARRKLAV